MLCDNIYRHVNYFVAPYFDGFKYLTSITKLRPKISIQ